MTGQGHYIAQVYRFQYHLAVSECRKGGSVQSKYGVVAVQSWLVVGLFSEHPALCLREK